MTLLIACPTYPLEAAHLSGRQLAIEEDHVVTAGLVDREQAVVEAIDRALARMDDGTYGFCLETGLPIPHERLEALPYAERLVDYETEASGRPLRAVVVALDEETV